MDFFDFKMRLFEQQFFNVFALKIRYKKFLRLQLSSGV